MLAGTWLALVGGLVWWTAMPLLVGWQPRVVLTGSMLPSLRPGDVVLVAGTPSPADLPAGRIVVVDDPTRAGGSYAHRVVRRQGGLLVTRGDANAAEDFPPVTADRVLGEVRLVVPAVGLPAIWVRERRFGPAGLVLLATWLGVVVALRDWHPRHREGVDLPAA